MAVLLLFIALASGALVLLGLFADALDRWIERRERTSEPRMWRHPIARPGRRGSR